MKTDMPAAGRNVIEEELKTLLPDRTHHTKNHRGNFVAAITAALSAIAMAILFDKNRDNPATLG